ncbi:MAG TPA: chloride channel protein [Phycicoccus elongatus]|uniref:chloride channel protein n=1 Tax=Phycicoccus TaxID=367298 RepID=UPI00258FD723|nr:MULTISPECIES: chloride channel protein [Phycicoccus]MCO5303209.1 chloride channel protein [Phycicoccus sp.]HPK11400.1 chloride channel protein [Phycicoccus elongatus]HPQ72426.1 chloride channel protein [Phycicoccus elongatus]
MSSAIAAAREMLGSRTGLRDLAVRARGTSGGLLVVAIVIGAGSAGFAVLFRWLIRTFTLLLSGHADYAATPGASNPHLPWLGRWFVVLAPVVAGLLYGPLVHFFAREARGHGVPEVMYAAARRGGRIPPQVAAVKALASALCIGGGGSVGREGPIVQIGSALGSTIGRVVGAPEARMRLFVACGAAGGIAATFNAPLAGVFFALELILADFTTSAFGMVVIAAVTAGAIGRAALGDVPFLQLPAFTVEHPAEYLLYAVLGVLAGVVGIVFTKVLYAIEDGCDAVWRGPEWLRPAVGGLALGLVLLLLPQMYGVGYPVLGNAVAGQYSLGFLVVLLVGKMVATSLTIGIGGSGGVFAPSLFTGAMLGSAFGIVAHAAFPGTAGPVGAYGLIGMGAVFAGAARAPITAVIILFELTGEYSIILPLMAAIVIATAVSHRRSADSIYTLKLRRRGIDLSTPVSPAQRIPVRAAMSPLPRPIPADASLADAATRLRTAAYGVLPVVEPDGRFRGIVTARAVADALAGGAESTSHADIITELPATVRVSDTLDDALTALTLTGCGAIPVFPDDGGGPTGWITYPSALAQL